MPVMISPRKLLEADEASDLRLDPFRKLRANLLRKYAGRHYGGNSGGIASEVINLIHHTVTTYVCYLLPDELQFLVRPNGRQSLYAASVLHTEQLKRLAREIDLVETLYDLMIDALLGPHAILRTGLRAGDKLVKVQGRLYNAGQFFAQYIDFDDWGVDPMARTRAEAYWERVRYRIPRVVALESGIFNQEEILRLPAIDAGDVTQEMSEAISQQPSGIDERFGLTEIIELSDFVIYESDGASYEVTLPGNKQHVGNEYLYLEEYQGPERGPFEWLSFGRLPNNVPGLGPIVVWQDIADAMNEVGAKMLRNAAHAKTIFAYNRGAADDAKELREASDMSAVGVDSVDALMKLDLGGVHSGAGAFLQQAMGLFNLISGNVNLLGGSPEDLSSDTLGEAQMLQTGASMRVKFMEGRRDRFLRLVAGRMLWEIRNDPLRHEVLPYRISGTESIEVAYSPQTKEGDDMDFGVDVVPFVPQNMDPNVRARRLMELYAKVIPALLQTWLNSMGAFNPVIALRQIGQEMGLPELSDVMQDAESMMIREMIQQKAMMEAQAMPGQPMGPTPGLGAGAGTRAMLGSPGGDGEQSTGRGAGQAGRDGATAGAA